MAVVVSNSARRPRGNARSFAHIYLHDWVPQFPLVSRIIGISGANMKAISDVTDTKLRVRGCGSGHLEFDGKGHNAEAPAHLMLAVTGHKGHLAQLHRAVLLSIELLLCVQSQLREFCGHDVFQSFGLSTIFGFGDVSCDARSLMAPLVRLHSYVPCSMRCCSVYGVARRSSVPRLAVSSPSLQSYSTVVQLWNSVPSDVVLELVPLPYPVAAYPFPGHSSGRHPVWSLQA